MSTLSDARGPLPHEPESIAEAAARYPLAVETLYTVAEAIEHAPGQDRKHVFDFADGLRLIVSREFLGEDVIHVSSSAAPDSEIFRDVMGLGPLLLGSFLSLCETRFRAISGHAGEMRLAVLSARGIPHWIVPLGRRAS